ncbi:Uncharacterized protein APZ42_024344 [Daphnia magna]|uniref:Uncharacterized protein n=1 Tax=Daphnia magna TaxID=35525 RepID=A0A164UN14_9CRUS|nr:Uncharacterized protein APZ42_024344 [Daphnia magna]
MLVLNLQKVSNEIPLLIFREVTLNEMVRLEMEKITRYTEVNWQLCIFLTAQ